MSYNFTLRIYKPKSTSSLSRIQNITISGITLISKPEKFSEVCVHLSNQKKFGYTLSCKKEFSKASGSHSYPSLTFKGDYIDIEVKNFPRFPAIYQDSNAAINILKGYGCNYINNGFPNCLLYRKIEILMK